MNVSKPVKKRPLKDPRTRPPQAVPDCVPVVPRGHRPNLISFKRESKSDVHAASSSTSISSVTPVTSQTSLTSIGKLEPPCKRAKVEWTTDAKVQLSPIGSIVQQIVLAAKAKDDPKFRLMLSKMTSVYLHRFTDKEATDAIVVLRSLFNELDEYRLHLEEVLNLIRVLFVKYDISSIEAEKVASSCSRNKILLNGPMFALISTILQKDKITTTTCSSFVDVAQTLMASTSEFRQQAAVFLVTYMQKSVENLELCLFLLQYSNDRNPKIRKVIVEGFEKLFSHEKKAPLDAYDLFIELSHNSDKFVRLSALRIIRLYADFFKDATVSNDRKFPLQLVDDAFTAVCHAMNDIDVDVRAQAAQLLGTFDDVSETFLFQTLDKKLMKNMRMLSDGRVATGGSSEWSTGKVLGEGCPIEEASTEDAQSLIPTGACGAFVTALEDEFKAVRQPAVYSLGKLAMNRPAFANASIEHLADMFNDEITEVRLDAIKALSPLVTYGVLEIEQLRTLLTGLDDSSQTSRIALHDLLGRSNFTQTECIRDLMYHLIESLRRFPEDKLHVFRCISAVGKRHSLLVGDIVGEVFGLHPILDRVEQPLNDVYYLVKLILILTAASKSAAVVSLLPSYACKHYRFLRLSMPNLVPAVAQYDMDCAKPALSERKPSDLNATIGNQYSRMLELQRNESIVSRQKDFAKFLKDLSFFLNVEPEYARASTYLHSLGSVMELLDRISMTLQNGNISSFLELQEAFEKISFVENVLQGVSKPVLVFLLECSVILNVVYVGVRLMADSARFERVAPLVFADELRRVQTRLIALDEEPTPQLSDLLRLLMPKKMTMNGAGILDGVCTKEVRLYSDIDIKFNEVQIKSVKVVRPTETVGAKVLAGLPTGVPVTCILNNLTEEDISAFRVWVKYADNTSSYFLAPRTDFYRMSDVQWRLTTHVLILAPDGLAAPVLVTFTFGLLVPRRQASAALFHDRCFGFLPSARLSANATGQFVALPNSEDLLAVAGCRVNMKPLNANKYS